MKNNCSDLISVVVPVYCVEAFLDRCVKSILNQTYQNFELILVDDGSPDNCGSMCDKYAQEDSRVIVVHKQNGGLSDARNAGIEIAKGEYITFIDSDDYVLADYIEYLYGLINEFDADISVCAHSAVYESGKILTQATGMRFVLNTEQALEKMLYFDGFDVSAWAKLYRTSFFELVRYPKGKIFEDAATTYKLFDQAKRVACGLESKYNYMIRENSIVTSRFSDNKLQLVSATNEMATFIMKKYPLLKDAAIRRLVYANFSTLCQMVKAESRWKEKEKELLAVIRKYSWSVLKNPKAPKRDKAAILSTIFGINMFKRIWLGYCKKTGRM